MEHFIFSETLVYFWLSTLKSSQYLFITSNFILKASKIAYSLLSQFTMTPCAQIPAGSSAPGSVPLIESGWRIGLQSFLCLRPSIALTLLTRSSGRWDLERQTGDHSHVIPSLFFFTLVGGYNLEWWAVKIFHNIKRTKEETASPMASCQAPGMRQPWELDPGQPPCRLLTWENWLSGCCQESRQWSFGYFTFESLTFVLLSPKVTFIGHLCMYAKR